MYSYEVISGSVGIGGQVQLGGFNALKVSLTSGNFEFKEDMGVLFGKLHHTFLDKRNRSSTEPHVRKDRTLRSQLTLEDE